MSRGGRWATSYEVGLQIAVVVCLVLAWLNPWTAGPSPAVVPWLVTVFFAAWLLIFVPALRVAPALIGGFALLAVVTVTWAPSSQSLGLLAALGVVSICAATGVAAARNNSLACSIAISWLVAGLLSSGMGLLQYAGLGDALGVWIAPARLGEAFANLRQRNQFATLTNIALVSLLWLVIRQRQMRAYKGALAFAAASLLSAGAAASGSRTGLLQLVLVVVLTMLWRYVARSSIVSLTSDVGYAGGKSTGLEASADAKAERCLVNLVLVFAVAGYVLAAVALPKLAELSPEHAGVFARLRDGSPGCASRLTLWSNVIQLIAQKPWFGWGWGELDFAHYMTLYPEARFCDILDNAHNLPLHLAVELGVPASFLFCGTVTWLILSARPWHETNALRQLAWSVLALIMLHSLLEYPLWYGPFQMAFGLCIGLLCAQRCLFRTAPRYNTMWSRRETPDFYLNSLSAIAVVTALAVVAWDYHRLSQIYNRPAERDPVYRFDTLNKVRSTRLFGDQLRFAQLSLTPLTYRNAAQIYALSTELLHYSPEPRVIEKVIESAVMVGHEEDALLHLARYRAAFPKECEQWRASKSWSALGAGSASVN